MAKAITVEDIAYAYIGNMELTGKAADHAMARFEGLGSILEENRGKRPGKGIFCAGNIRLFRADGAEAAFVLHHRGDPGSSSYGNEGNE